MNTTSDRMPTLLYLKIRNLYIHGNFLMMMMRMIKIKVLSMEVKYLLATDIHIALFEEDNKFNFFLSKNQNNEVCDK